MMKILITGGGTREPIDGVRFITNFSTGGTAAQMADFFTEQGNQVTYLQAQGSIRPALPYRVREFVTFNDLNQALLELLRDESFDTVIHLAAVSDYSVDSIETDGKKWNPGDAGKLPSGKEVVLRLKPHFKIVDRIRSYSKNSKLVLVAFKLTHTNSTDERLKKIQALAQNPEIDYVVHNDLTDRMAQRPVFTLFENKDHSLHPLAKFQSPIDLAQGLAQWIPKKLEDKR